MKNRAGAGDGAVPHNCLSVVVVVSSSSHV